MRQGVYNELRAVELIAAWIPHVPEREIRDVLLDQLDDERRHYRLRRGRLLELGEAPDADRPLPEWEALFDWPVACGTRPTLEKLTGAPVRGRDPVVRGIRDPHRARRGRRSRDGGAVPGPHPAR
jgi:hypothetical protein